MLSAQEAQIGTHKDWNDQKLLHDKGQALESFPAVYCTEGANCGVHCKMNSLLQRQQQTRRSQAEAVHRLTWGVQFSSHTRHDPLSQGVVQAEWVTNGIHLLTNQQVGGLS